MGQAVREFSKAKDGKRQPGARFAHAGRLSGSRFGERGSVGNWVKRGGSCDRPGGTDVRNFAK
jgi:hypothetical protein